MAVACYLGRVAIDLGLLRDWPALSARKIARWLWTLGCVLYLAHVICAFTFFHDWSHDHAYAQTAAQTEALIGVHWGGGLYFNYAFTLLWIVDTVAWWGRGVNAHHRARAYFWTMHAVIAFMVFNATVVFGPAVWRWVAPIVGVVFAIVYFQSTRGRDPLLS